MTLEDRIKAIGRKTLDNSMDAEIRGDREEFQRWHEVTLLVTKALDALTEKESERVCH